MHGLDSWGKNNMVHKCPQQDIMSQKDEVSWSTSWGISQVFSNQHSHAIVLKYIYLWNIIQVLYVRKILY